MILGAGTSWKLQVIPSASGALRGTGSVVVVSNATPPVVDGTNTGPVALAAAISSSGSAVDLVAGVASTRTRIDQYALRNESSTVAPDVTFQLTDGTNTSTVYKATLQPGESIGYSQGVWTHYDSQGAPYVYGGPPVANLGATGTIAETMPRETCPEVNTTMAASGTLNMQAIYLKAGQIISNITIWSATTAASSPTNYFFALYDSSRNLLAQSTNQTTNAWAANTKKTLSLTASYRVPVSGLYYIGYFMSATTVPTLKGGTAKTGGQLAGDTPILQGTSSTGLTTALPNPAATLTVSTASFYAAVS